MSNISKNKKYHYLYKTTNLVNGKYYYGMHSTNNLEDGYLGSGKYLWYAIKKYGVINFQIQILEFFASREALVVAEKNLITELQVADLNCMNLKPGGRGGFVDEGHRDRWLNARSTTHKELWQMLGEEMKQVQVDRFRSDPEYRSMKQEQLRQSANRRRAAGCFGFQGRVHKPETIEKMKQHKGKQVKEKNSQFGTKWITNEKENKKIKNDSPIPEGWRLGRKIK